MSGVNKGILTLSDFEQINNQTDINSPVLSFKVPRSEIYLLMENKPVNIFLPTRETLAHGGTGEEELSLSNDIVDSGALGDDLTALATTIDTGAGSEILDITAIDYDNDTVTVDHDSAENIYVYYLPKDGEVSIDVVAPFANGNLRKTVFNESLGKIHTINQFGNNSLLTLDRSFIVPETFYIQVFYNGARDIRFYTGEGIGYVKIPFRTQSTKKFPADISEKVINEMIAK